MRRIWRWARFILVDATLTVLLLVLIFIVSLSVVRVWGDKDYSALYEPREASLMYAETGEVMAEFCLDFCKENIPLSDMGNFVEAVVVIEDREFWQRRWIPFSLKSLARAAWNELRRKPRDQGGSTIEMQLARLTFLREDMKLEWDKQATGELKRHKFRKYWRKIKELYIAEKIRSLADRRLILTLYLNNVPCGHNQQGVQACSRYYFDKHAKDLTLSEATMIIGTFRSPQFSPFLQPREAMKLRERVLARLANVGFISREQFLEFNDTAIPQKRVRLGCGSGHDSEFVRRKVVEEMRLTDSGLRIYTTINCKWTKAAYKSLYTTVEEMKLLHPNLSDLRGVAMLINRHTGGTHAFVQYPTIAENKYLIDQMKRPPGSVFKVVTYAAWLRNGGRLTCTDNGTGPCRLDDSYGRADGTSGLFLPITRGTKHFQNFDAPGMPRYIGMAEPLLMLAESHNVGTLSMVKGIMGSRAAQIVSVQDILELSAVLGIKLPAVNLKGQALWQVRTKGISVLDVDISRALQPNLTEGYGVFNPGHTVAIGSMDVSPIEMLRAVTGLIGQQVSPYFIQAIRDVQNNRVKDSEAEAPTMVIDKFLLGRPENYDAQLTAEALTSQMLRGMRATIEFPHGTGKMARVGDEKRQIMPLNFPICGKTGTATNDNGDTTDLWFVGCTPSYAMIVWLGREKRLPIEEVTVENSDGSRERIRPTGGRYPLHIFMETMRSVYEDQPKEQFPLATNPLKMSRSPGDLEKQTTKESIEEESLYKD